MNIQETLPAGSQKNKYKLNDLMTSLPQREYKRALRELPKLIGRSKGSLHLYRYIPFGSNASLPYEVGLAIERYFNIPAGSLLTEAEESL